MGGGLGENSRVRVAIGDARTIPEAATARAGSRPFRAYVPSVLIVIGLLLLIGALLAAAPAAHAASTHTWGGGGANDNWSNPSNWVDGVAPSDGDSLVFAGTRTRSINDCLTRVSDVSFTGTDFVVTGDPVTIGGRIGCDAGGITSTWDIDTTLGADLTASFAGATLNLAGDLSLGGATSYTLTASGTGSLRITGAISGGDAGTAIEKTGTGALRLAGTGTWTGGVSVSAGMVVVEKPEALAGGSSVPVSLAEGSYLVALFDSSAVTGTWDNVFSGSGSLIATAGTLTLSGDSSDFLGTMTAVDDVTVTGRLGPTTVEGKLRGTGFIGNLMSCGLYGQGGVRPGLVEYSVGQLEFGAATLPSGGSYVVDMVDASGAAGTGYDSLAESGSGGITVTSTVASPFYVRLHSSDGTASAAAANFDSSRGQRWPIASAPAGLVTGFSADKFILDTSGFVNSLDGGVFTLEQSADATTLDLVFTPAPQAGFGSGLTFGSGYLAAPSSSSIALSGPSDFTIEMWIRPESGRAGNETLMRQREGGYGTLETWLAVNNAGGLFCGLQNGAYPGWTWFGGGTISAEEWSHVALVKRGGSIEIYVDGRLDGSGSYGWPISIAAASQGIMTFGGDTTPTESNFLEGKLDEIQVYDRALSATELADEYNRGLGQSLSAGASGPVRYYRLDEGAGTTAADAGSNGVAAALAGLPSSPWIESTAAREFTSVSHAATPVALAYGDAGAASLTVSVVEQPAHGTVDLTSPSLGRGTYTPTAGWYGTETFTYRVTNGLTSATQTATVTSENDTHTWDGGGADGNWSTAANWVGDVLPGDGDDLSFPNVGGRATNNFLASAGSVTVDGPTVVDGSALDIGGPVTATEDAEWSVSRTTLSQDLTISETPGAGLAPMILGGEIELQSAEYGAHGVTFDVAALGAIRQTGSITGADAACTLAKTGLGTLTLGSGSTWAGANSWLGATSVQQGTLALASPNALAADSAVAISAGAAVDVAFASAATRDVCSNVFTGAGEIDVSGADLTLTGASPSFSGAVSIGSTSTVRITGSTAGSVAAAGPFRGTGSAGALEVLAGGSVSPGVEDIEEATLTAGATTLDGAGALAWDIGDVDAGAGSGYDQLVTSGDLSFASSDETPFVIRLRSGNGGDAGPATGFDATKSYRWQAVRVNGTITGFSTGKITLDDDAFVEQNPIGHGAFGVEVTSHSGYETVDIVFAPREPNVHVWDGGGSDANWSTAANWVGDEAPYDGDTVRFAGTTRQLNTNDLLTSVGGIEFVNGGFFLDGSALKLTGNVVNAGGEGSSNWIEVPLTLDGPSTLSTADAGQLTTMLVHLVSATGGHGLAVAGPGTVNLMQVTGASTDSTLTKNGTGTVDLLTGSFGGAVSVNAGTLRVLATSGLPAGVPVSVAAGGTLLCSSATGGESFAWNNVFSGESGATLALDHDTLTLTGDSPAYAGGVDVSSTATLKLTGRLGGQTTARLGGSAIGNGTFGTLVLGTSGSLSPGLADYGVAGPVATGTVALGDGTYTVDMVDAAGAAGTGYDTTAATTGVDVTATATTPATLKLRSSDGSAAAPAQGFDNSTHHRWHIMSASGGSVTGFDSTDFAIDISEFENDLAGGAFSLGVSPSGSALDLIFNPAGPDTHTWDGEAGDLKWSSDANWVGDVAPSNGDDLVFLDSAALGFTNTNDCLTSVRHVRLASGFTILGDAVTMTGSLTAETTALGHCSWGPATTMGADVTFSNAGAGALTVGDVSLMDGASAHALTVTAGGSVDMEGDISGAATGCTLTKQGAGELRLGGANKFDGALTISGGAVRTYGAQALPAGAPVSVASGTSLTAVTRAGGGGAGTWDNVFSGPGALIVELDHLRLTGESPAFTGRVTVDQDTSPSAGGPGVLIVDGSLAADVDVRDGGTLGGGGSVALVNGGLDIDGLVWPGAADLVPARLSSSAATLSPGSPGKACVADATGAPGVGYDQLATGDLTVSSSAAHPCTISLASVRGGAAGPCAHFDKTQSYRWRLIDAGGIESYEPGAIAVDATAFAAENDLDGGAFSVETGVDGTHQTIDAVFTPCAEFTAGPVVGDGGDSFIKGSTQTITWGMDRAPVSGDLFKVVADDPGSSINVLLGTVDATSATEYSFDWTIAQGPSAGWFVSVQLWTPGSSGTQLRSADGVTFDILAPGYAITVTPGEHGDITPHTGLVDTYSTPTYTIMPEVGYHVADVLVDGDSVGAVASYTFSSVKAAHSIAATFGIDTFAITPSVVGGGSGHGTITPSSVQTVAHGSTPSFTFTPDVHYHVKQVTVDGAAVAMTGTDEYRFPAVTADHAISVEFAIDTYTITVQPGAHGTISPGTGIAEWGSSHTFTMTPQEGYAVADVVVDGTSVGAVTSYEFTQVQAAHSIAASFTAGGMPTTTVTGAVPAWSKRPVELTLTGHPGPTGVPIAFTEYKVGGRSWAQGGRATIDREGVTVVRYRSQDDEGVREDPARQCTVRVDTRRPRVVARRLVTRRGSVARLRYLVKDPLPSSGSALVRAVVTNASGHVVTRASTVPVSTNHRHVLRIRTGRLAPGAYSVTLRGKDKAGNYQRGLTRVVLVVR